MQFDIITIFPKIFDSYFGESIIKRGQKKSIIKIISHDLRTYTRNKHKKTDDTPYGGGAGMVMMTEPIIRAVDGIIKKKVFRSIQNKTKIVSFSAKGKPFNQKMAYDWSKKYNRIILISGRYEGIDERASTILKKTYKGAFEEISIGPYVFTDGDIAAMVVVSAVSRLIPGVIRPESLLEESHSNQKTSLEYPHYTRPETIVYRGKKYSVPRVLLSGDHQKISRWRSSKTQ